MSTVKRKRRSAMGATDSFSSVGSNVPSGRKRSRAGTAGAVRNGSKATSRRNNSSRLATQDEEEMEEEDGELTRGRVRSMTCPQLRKHLAHRGLPTTGVKAVILKRLLDSLDEEDDPTTRLTSTGMDDADSDMPEIMASPVESSDAGNEDDSGDEKESTSHSPGRSKRKRPPSLPEPLFQPDPDLSDAGETHMDPVLADACHQFLALSKQLSSTAVGTYISSERGSRVFQLRRRDNGGMEVLGYEESQPDLEAEAAKARQKIEAQLQESRQKHREIEDEIGSLQQKIREGGTRAEALGQRLTELLMIAGQLAKKIQDLQATTKRKVDVEVEGVCERVLVYVAEAVATKVVQQRVLPLMEHALYVLGGASAGACMGTVEKYDEASQRWKLVSPMSIVRDNCAVVSLTGELYALGGSTNAGGSLSSVEVYEPDTDSWSKLPDMKSSRSMLGAVAHNACIYAMGGIYDSTQAFMEKYSTVSRQWQALPSPAALRNGMAAVLLQDQIWLCGGVSAGEVLDSVEYFDLLKNKWCAGPPLRYKRNGCTGAVLDGKIYVIGGFDGKANVYSSVERYEPRKQEWQEVAPLTLPRFFCSVAVLRGSLVVSGGKSSQSGKPLASVEKYDPLKDKWEVMEPGLLGPRWGHASACTSF